MAEPLDLAAFDVTKERGFLPPRNPYRNLPLEMKAWDDFVYDLPALLAARQVGSRIHKLPRFNVGILSGDQFERARAVLAYIHNAYLWELHQENIARTSIPEHLAVPLVAVSKLIGRPPILSYADYALNNWRLIDERSNRGPIELGNIALLHYFWGGLDEAWFTLVHIEIEAKAGKAVVGAIGAQECAQTENCFAVDVYLHEIHASLVQVNKTFNRMPECCAPRIYKPRVRPWIHGTKNNPAVPEGVVYEGVEEFGGKPQKFRGETGAQSSIAPLLDAAFGVVHAPNTLSEHLTEMRDYMPPKHRELIATVEARPAMRNFVLRHKSLHDIFNACIDEMYTFRKTHYRYAWEYIFSQEGREKEGSNPTAIGTGGTDFMESLKKHLDETLEAKV